MVVITEWMFVYRKHCVYELNVYIYFRYRTKQLINYGSVLHASDILKWQITFFFKQSACWSGLEFFNYIKAKNDYYRKYIKKDVNLCKVYSELILQKWAIDYPTDWNFFRSLNEEANKEMLNKNRRNDESLYKSYIFKDIFIFIDIIRKIVIHSQILIIFMSY